MEFGLTSSLARRSPSWCNWWKHSSRIRRWLIWSVVHGICGLWLVVNDCYWLVLLFLSFLWYIQNSEIQNMLTQPRHASTFPHSRACCPLDSRSTPSGFGDKDTMGFSPTKLGFLWLFARFFPYFSIFFHGMGRQVAAPRWPQGRSHLPTPEAFFRNWLRWNEVDQHLYYTPKSRAFERKSTE